MSTRNLNIIKNDIIHFSLPPMYIIFPLVDFSFVQVPFNKLGQLAFHGLTDEGT